MSFLHELERSFAWLINHSLQAGALVLLVLLLQWVFRRHLTNRWRFAIWWIVLVRLLLPVGPESALSVFNYLHPPVILGSPAVSTPTASPRPGAPFTPGYSPSTSSRPISVARGEPRAPVSSTITRRESALSEPPPRAISVPAGHRATVPDWASFRKLLLPGAAVAWLAGAIGLSLCVLIQLWRFQRRLHRSSTPADPGLPELLDSCRHEFGVARPIELLETEAVSSPALFGLRRLRLLLPGGMGASFNRTELRYIFLHELAHVKRGDLWLNWLVTVLQILHWFNPLIWLGFARLRADRELACDELALIRAGEKVGTSYGETVIKLLEGLSRPAAIPGLVGILEDRKQMRRRISMIANFRKPGRWSALAVLLLAGVALTTLTDAQTSGGSGRRIRAATDVTHTLNPTNTAVSLDPYNMPPNQPPDHAVAELPKRPDLHGRITGEDGDALPATVFIYTAGPKVGTSTFCPSCYADCAKSAKTDADGDFTIKSLDPQLIFRILVVASDYQPKFVGKVDPTNGPVAVELEPLASSTVPPENRVLGRVADAKGTPVVGAVVEARGIRTKDGGGTWGTIPGLDPLAVTDDNGEFELSSRRAFAGMDVRVEARGFAPKSFTRLAGVTARHDLVVGEGASITGQVRFHGKPLEGVSVGVSAVDREAGAYAGHFDVGTDAAGRFALVNLPPDTDYYIYGHMKTIGRYGAIPIRKVRSGKDGAVIDVGDLDVSSAHRLAGRVVLADGKPLPPDTRFLIGRQQAWDSMQLTPDPDGRFDIAGIPSEAISLSVRVPGYRTSGKNASLDPLNPFELVGRVDRDVTNLVVLLERGKELRPDFNNTLSQDEWPQNRPLRGAEGAGNHSDQWSISGRVLDVAQHPVEHFLVTPGELDQFGNVHWDTVHSVDGNAGSYQLYVSRRSVQPWLKASAQGFLPTAKSLPAGDGTNVDFSLKTGSGPRGAVLGPDGAPAAGAKLVLLCEGGGPNQVGFNFENGLRAYWDRSLETQADQEGRFSFKPEWKMQSVAAASSNGFALVNVESLATNPIIRLEAFGTITGTLQRTSGPGTNEDLDLSFADLGSRGIPRIGLNNHTVTDSQGRFEFDHVPPGALKLTYREPMGARSWQNMPLEDLDLKPGKHLVVHVETSDRPPRAARESLPAPLPKPIAGAQIKGVILSPDGKPAADAEVALQVQGEYLAVGKGRLIGGNLGTARLVVDTGPDGTFSLPAYPQMLSLLAVNSDGFARILPPDLSSNLVVKLEKWGRVEGTFTINGHPGTNDTLVLSPVVHGRDFFILDGNSFQASVGGQGRFAFNYVPPVEMVVALKLPTGPGSWNSRRLGTVQVDPGESAHANFAENGRTVTGKVEVTGTKAPFDFQNALAALETGDKAILQKMVQLKTPEEWRKFRESPEVKAAMKDHQRYPVRLDPDGSFRANDIPAGTYEFSLMPTPIRFRQGMSPPSVQMLLSSREITVPKPKNASEPSPVNLGTIELRTLTIPVESPSSRGE